MNISIQPQFALFLDNRPGALAKICEALAHAKINLLALSILDTVDHAIVRLVTDRPKETEQLLVRLHPVAQRRDVVMLELPNVAGSLAQVAERLSRAGINLEYAYCTATAGQASGALVLRTNDLEATIDALG